MMCGGIIAVGLTGGVGSGKSTVCRMFRMLGIPAYDTDLEAKRLMSECEEVREAVMRRFGGDTYKGGALDRAYLAERVFNDKSELKALNAIVHPAVKRDFRKWLSERRDDSAPYVIMESAILFESGFDELVDVSVTVSAPVVLRVQRVAERDGHSPEKVMARINNQMTDAERESLSDYVIINDGQTAVWQQVLEIDGILRSQNTDNMPCLRCKS